MWKHSQISTVMIQTCPSKHRYDCDQGGISLSTLKQIGVQESNIMMFSPAFSCPYCCRQSLLNVIALFISYAMDMHAAGRNEVFQDNNIGGKLLQKIDQVFWSKKYNGGEKYYTVKDFAHCRSILAVCTRDEVTHLTHRFSIYGS
jgi:hypothetical protein